MGFYPVTPGSPVYSIGSPLFGKTTIRTAEGVEFIIEAKNNSSENRYIQSATLNGEVLNIPEISHADIMKGGRLTFVMGPEPNKELFKLHRSDSPDNR
jgi:putative alpha-1,2-mannosidase